MELNLARILSHPNGQPLVEPGRHGSGHPKGYGIGIEQLDTVNFFESRDDASGTYWFSDLEQVVAYALGEGRDFFGIDYKIVMDVVGDGEPAKEAIASALCERARTEGWKFKDFMRCLIPNDCCEFSWAADRRPKGSKASSGRVTRTRKARVSNPKAKVKATNAKKATMKKKLRKATSKTKGRKAKR